jgi:molybdopterin converting factor small subunit
MILGSKRRCVNSEGNALRDLIHALDHMTTGKLEREVVGSEGRLDPKFKIFVNGKERDDLETPLRDGDDILLFGVIDGG